MGKYWIQSENGVEGPYEIDHLKFLPDFSADALLLEADSQNDEAWVHAAEVEELRELLRPSAAQLDLPLSQNPLPAPVPSAETAKTPTEPLSMPEPPTPTPEPSAEEIAVTPINEATQEIVATAAPPATINNLVDTRWDEDLLEVQHLLTTLTSQPKPQVQPEALIVPKVEPDPKVKTEPAPWVPDANTETVIEIKVDIKKFISPWVLGLLAIFLCLALIRYRYTLLHLVPIQKLLHNNAPVQPQSANKKEPPKTERQPAQPLQPVRLSEPKVKPQNAPRAKPKKQKKIIEKVVVPEKKVEAKKLETSPAPKLPPSKPKKQEKLKYLLPGIPAR